MWRVINQGKNLWNANKLYNAYFGWSQGFLKHSSTAVVSFNPLIIKKKATYSGAGMTLAIPDGVTNVNIAATNNGSNHFYLRITFRKDFELCFAPPTGSGQFPYNFIKVEPGERKLLSAAIPDGYRYAVVSIDSDLGIGTLLHPTDVVVGFDLKTDEYMSSLQQSLESSLELFGYNGVYDEITSDGLVVKRWNRETVTVSSGSATLSKSGRGNAIVVAVSDGVPYDGTVSGTTLTTSAPDGEYVVIYQLATPEIQKLDYSGELILYPGKNYLVTDSKTPIAISIKGAKKYLEG